MSRKLRCDRARAKIKKLKKQSLPLENAKCFYRRARARTSMHTTHKNRIRIHLQIHAIAGPVKLTLMMTTNGDDEDDGNRLRTLSMFLFWSLFISHLLRDNHCSDAKILKIDRKYCGEYRNCKCDTANCQLRSIRYSNGMYRARSLATSNDRNFQCDEDEGEGQNSIENFSDFH